MSQHPHNANQRHLLDAAHAAIDSGDLERADGLFLEHLDRERADPAGLAAYGNFCLRTGRPEEACYLLYKAARLGAGSADLLGELGHARLESNDPEGARRAFEQAIALDPRDAIANYGLAVCHQQLQDWPAAVAGFERALAAQPDTVPIALNLASACKRMGDTARASFHFAQAARLAPDDPAVLLEYGRFLRETGAFAAALGRMEFCARTLPEEPLVLLELARCQRAMGHVARAMGTLDRLENLAPGMPEFHEQYGDCFAALGDGASRDLRWSFACRLWLDARNFDLAGPLIEKMLETHPANPDAWNSKGTFHDFQQQIDLAEAAYRRSFELDPQSLAPIVNLGNLYETSNRLDEALGFAENGLRIAAAQSGPPHVAVTGLHLLRAKIARRQKQYAVGIGHLDAIEGMPKSGTEEQTALFERAKILDLLDDTDGAIAVFNRANAIAVVEPGVEDPDGNKFVRGIDYLLELVGKGWLETWTPTPANHEGPTPVFLLGYPRSGTTLLNTVLYSHSAIEVVEERQTFAKVLGLARRMPKGYPHVLPECDALDADIMRETYWRSVAELASLAPGQLLIDKFPFYLTVAGLIHVAFPRAKFLFALRHPCDAILSCFMQNFRLNEAMANFRTLGETAALYAKTMDLWQAYRDAFGLQVHTIRYEAMVDDFEGEVRSLCDFLDVPWEEGLRQFSTRALDRGKINTPSYEQVSKPIYREARYRWERYRKHLEPHLALLQPYIERFGYDTKSG